MTLPSYSNRPPFRSHPRTSYSPCLNWLQKLILFSTPLPTQTRPRSRKVSSGFAESIPPIPSPPTPYTPPGRPTTAMFRFPIKATSSSLFHHGVSPPLTPALTLPPLMNQQCFLSALPSPFTPDTHLSSILLLSKTPCTNNRVHHPTPTLHLFHLHLPLKRPSLPP